MEFSLVFSYLVTVMLHFYRWHMCLQHGREVVPGLLQKCMVETELSVTIANHRERCWGYGEVTFVVQLSLLTEQQQS
jgi:hypothetical protein